MCTPWIDAKESQPEWGTWVLGLMHWKGELYPIVVYYNDSCWITGDGMPDVRYWMDIPDYEGLKR